MVLPQSWVQSANKTSTPFPLNNLPYGVFSSAKLSPRCGVAIGDQVLDIRSCEAAGLIPLVQKPIFAKPHWNRLMALDGKHWQRFRAIITDLLREGSAHQQDLQAQLTPLAQANLHMPFEVREFTDLCAADCYRANFSDRSDALPKTGKYGSHTSTVVVSGTPIRRPNGFKSSPQAECASFGPSTRIDVACEMGAVVGGSCAMGRSFTNEQADAMIFGYVLLSNWSALDTNSWGEHRTLESSWMKPFATSISPWIVSAAALDPFRVATAERGRQLSSYQRTSESMLNDIEIVIELQPENDLASVIADINYHEICYSPAQQLARHVSSGHTMGGGDLIGLNTVFVSERKRRAELMGLAWNGKDSLELHDSNIRHIIEDGDTLRMTGTARNSELHIGFGNCQNKVLPAVLLPRLAYKPSATHYHYRYG